MTALEAGQCVGKLMRGPLDGLVGIIAMDLVPGTDGEYAPPALAGFRELGHGEGCPGGAVYPYRLDTTQMAIEADGTEVFVYFHDPELVTP